MLFLEKKQGVRRQKSREPSSSCFGQGQEGHQEKRKYGSQFGLEMQEMKAISDDLQWVSCAQYIGTLNCIKDLTFSAKAQVVQFWYF